MTDGTISNEEFKGILQYDPGNSIFVGYADRLRADGHAEEAIQVCLLGLTHNPTFHRGRLLLARLFYDKGYIPFAVREIEYLMKALPDNLALKKLLQKLSPSTDTETTGTAISQETTLAEAEFDIGELEMVEDDKEAKKRS